jgi:hypothetical protein
MRYSTKLTNEIMTLQLSNGKEYNLHYLSNYSDYSLPPANLLKITDIDDNYKYKFTNEHPSLMEKWKNGDFIHSNNLRYERLSQYEYDKYCYKKNIKNSNSEIYKLFLKIVEN